MMSTLAGPTKDFDLIPIPQRLRYNPTRPFPEFGIGLNLFSSLRVLLVSLRCAFHANVLFISSVSVVANLYYCQALLCVSGSLDSSEIVELTIISNRVL